MKIKSVLTIAGSDPSSGAGIQADLKTFSLLGVYGCSVITTITVQNTNNFSQIFALPPTLVAEQIKTIFDDIKIEAIKIGVVYNQRIMNCIYKILKSKDIPIIIDPVFFSSNQFALLKTNSLNQYIDKILPLATIITPNIKEAELIAKRRMKDKKSIIDSLNLIKSFGPKNVILKSVRIKRKKSTDLLLDQNDNITEFSNPLQLIAENHGSGCNFSSAITSFIAKGYNIQMACRMGNELLNRSLKNLFQIGRGLPIVDPSFGNYIELFRYQVLSDLTKAVEELQEIENVGLLVPETQTNFVYAVPEATTVKDIAAVKGRLIKIGKKVVPASCVEFGSSKHVASALLEYMKLKTTIRSAINIRYDIKILEICKRFLVISEYNRKLEPQKIREAEGSSVKWGIKEALTKNSNARLIYHKGDIGKEPMIILFGNSPQDIVKYLKKILIFYS